MLLGGAHRTISAIFNFTMLAEKVVNTDRVNDTALVRFVQFSEPVSSQWHTVAQTQLFAHFLQTCDSDMKSKSILETFLGSKRNEGMEMRHRLFANRFKSETSAKRFFKWVRKLTAIGCLECM